MSMTLTSKRIIQTFNSQEKYFHIFTFACIVDAIISRTVQEQESIKKIT